MVAGPSGCFVKRDLSTIPDFDYEKSNCTGKDSTSELRLVRILNIKSYNMLNPKKRHTSALDLNGSSVKIAHSKFSRNLIVQ